MNSPILQYPAELPAMTAGGPPGDAGQGNPSRKWGLAPAFPVALIGSLLNLETAGRRLFFITTARVDEHLTDIIKQLRSANGDCGIVVFCPLDARAEQEALAVEYGADDCIPLPVDFLNLVTRLRATAARLRRSQAPVPLAAALQVDTLTYTVRVGDRSFTPSPLQSHLLHALWDRRGTVVSYGTLEHLLWGDTEIASRQALKQLMKRLRGQLGDASQSIRAVPGVGYLLE